LYLKTINLRGFKSFKSKSTLTFEPGISVVVGPNGSGKSNIADSISWVLGEQSPKSLRGSSMGDIIFKNRQEEMGIAEVSLIFDNRDRTLDLDFSDVRITRRVYSQGGSDYFINSSPARLMDIQELLADRGIGKGLYTIINQGQINEMAMLKPFERRLIIDEVGGISKHKSRRDRSLAKLGRVKQDIERIEDLLEEIERTMLPLEAEAAKAAKYSEVLNQLKKEEISYYIQELDSLNKNWKKKEDFDKALGQKLEKTRQKLVLHSERLNDYTDHISDKMDEYRFWENMANKLQNEIGRLKNIEELAASKVNMFSTLAAMFDKTHDYPQKKDVSIYQRLKDLRMLVSKYISRVSSLLSQKEIKEDGLQINKRMESLLELFRKEEKEELKKEERKKIEKLLRKGCSNNFSKAKNLLAALKVFKLRADDLNNGVLPHFLERKKEIETEKALIEELGTKVNETKMEKNNIENEVYKNKLDREQIKEKTKDITKYIVDNYNLSIDYMLKNYRPSDDLKRSRTEISRLKKQIKGFGPINPNASIEYKRIKGRYDFLNGQKNDLVQSKQKLEKMIKDMETKIMDAFLDKFEKINKSFNYYFKILFPLGKGELTLLKEDNGELGVDLKADIGNNKFVPLSLLSGGEKALVSIAFLFSIFSTNISPFYVFDEADAALDDINLDRFLSLVVRFAKKQQVILITHQKKTMEIADTIYGVSMQSDGVSKIVSEKISEKYAKID